MAKKITKKTIGNPDNKQYPSKINKQKTRSLFETGSVQMKSDNGMALSRWISGLGQRRILIVAVVAIAVLAFLLFQNKNKFVVAIVNGQPITRWQLNDELASRYGQRTLDEMVSNKLVSDEIRKQNVVVSDDDIQKRIDELTKSLPQGFNLDEALKAQGTTTEQFRSQLHLQLAVDKLLSQDVSVSASEVEKYIQDNKQSLPATSDAELKKQAEDMLKKQKMDELVQGWFASLKEKANVQRFL